MPAGGSPTVRRKLEKKQTKSWHRLPKEPTRPILGARCAQVLFTGIVAARKPGRLKLQIYTGNKARARAMSFSSKLQTNPARTGRESNPVNMRTRRKTNCYAFEQGEQDMCLNSNSSVPAGDEPVPAEICQSLLSAGLAVAGSAQGAWQQ